MIHIAFESSTREERSIDYGPFSYAQLTYDVLRIGDDGETFAERDPVTGYWHGPYGEGYCGDKQWSDIIIWAVDETVATAGQ